MSHDTILGIDLGTTHCALAISREEKDSLTCENVSILQLVGRSSVDRRPLLPSFLYIGHESEGAFALPWDSERRFVVGELARDLGVSAPLRVVSSAKSWLSHAGVDRRGAILPLAAPSDVEKISPVEASFRYLEHLLDAWRQSEEGPANLQELEVVLTVPASFDAAARDLTVEAAIAAGIEKLTLLEEPQAALYAWIADHAESWRQQIKAGDVILVVDVGGGTTDFSAIAAVERDGSLELVRVAVGDHILLGGDNMDLALAYTLRSKLAASGKELDRWQLGALTHACRSAKEKLFADTRIAAVPVVIPSRGSQLLGSALQSEITREEVDRVLLEGFFPRVSAGARPASRARGGLTQVGLPYASDAAISRHLAHFLARQASALDTLGAVSGRASARSLLHPTAVLFNGGVMKSHALRQRILDNLETWITEEGGTAPRELEGSDKDTAVARGAAAYGRARRGRGLRIRGGTARSYYIGIESPAPAVPGFDPPTTALCLAPFGMEEGTRAELPPHELGIVVGEPVIFRFFGSTVRREDASGAELSSWSADELEELAPVELELPAEGRNPGDVVPVHLQASVTAIGTLLVEAIPLAPRKPDERWKVELSVRGEVG